MFDCGSDRAAEIPSEKRTVMGQRGSILRLASFYSLADPDLRRGFRVRSL
jgi:hypothetical protein